MMTLLRPFAFVVALAAVVVAFVVILKYDVRASVTAGAILVGLLAIAAAALKVAGGGVET